MLKISINVYGTGKSAFEEINEGYAFNNAGIITTSLSPTNQCF